MGDFITALWTSVFEPGPTPTLLLATNATFAALQAVLLALLVGTRSIHFVVLSLLCAGLWASINWFARELVAAQRAEEARKERELAAAGKKADESETDAEGGVEGIESEGAATPRRSTRVRTVRSQTPLSAAGGADKLQGAVRRRMDGSGYLSTDTHYARILSRWPKDPLRPEVQFPKLLAARVAAAPKIDEERAAQLAQVLGSRPPRRSERDECNALYSLLEERYSKEYPLSPAMLRPASDPDYYERLLKELEETPNRSWFANLARRIGGMVRLS